MVISPDELIENLNEITGLDVTPATGAERQQRIDDEIAEEDRAQQPNITGEAIEGSGGLPSTGGSTE
jgi:hypothetical protein